MIQRVVIVLRVFGGQWVATDDQLQPVSSLCDQRYSQAAVKVPRPHVVHLNRKVEAKQWTEMKMAVSPDPHESAMTRG